MWTNKKYKIVSRSVFENNGYSLVPIRYEDRVNIMNWRNEQIDHLRQNKLLTIDDQDRYFSHVVAVLFDKTQPDQILFSYLIGETCIGYGGLVHINWTDRNAEVSFVMETKLQEEYFSFHWSNFLDLLETVAKEELQMHKLYTYAFDIRPYLYTALEGNGYIREAELKEHCFVAGKFRSVVIHSKILLKDEWKYRTANNDDAKLLFQWANDDMVRSNAFNNQKIDWENHLRWFNIKLEDPNCRILIFSKNDMNVGQIRLEKNDEYWLIDYSVDKDQRGLGYGTKMLLSVQEAIKDLPLVGKVKKTNTASIKAFLKAGFVRDKEIEDSEDNYLTFVYLKP